MMQSIVNKLKSVQSIYWNSYWQMDNRGMTVGWQEVDRRITRRLLEVEDYSRKVKDDNDKQMNNKRMSGAKIFMQYNMLLIVR